MRFDLDSMGSLKCTHRNGSTAVVPSALRDGKVIEPCAAPHSRRVEFALAVIIGGVDLISDTLPFSRLCERCRKF